MKNSTKETIAVKRLTFLIRALLLFGGLYFIAEGIIHLFAVRLFDVATVWPESAVVYAKWMGRFYGSFTLLAAAILLYIQKDIYKYKTFLQIIAWFTVFHGVLLIYGALSEKFGISYRSFPSLSFWIPFYDIYVVIEAFLLMVYSFSIFLWISALKRVHR